MRHPDVRLTFDGSAFLWTVERAESAIDQIRSAIRDSFNRKADLEREAKSRSRIRWPLPCNRCRRRGFVVKGGEASHCPICLGRTKITLSRMSALLSVQVGALRAVSEGGGLKVYPGEAEHVLEGLWTRFPEEFQ